MTDSYADGAPERDSQSNTSENQQSEGITARLIPVLVPALLLLASLILPGFMFHAGQRDSLPGLGPGAWPGAVLAALAVFSAIWLAIEIWGFARSRKSASLSAPHDEDVYHYGKAFIGIVLVIAFGWLLPVLGFPLATMLFLFIWCLYGGLRNPLVLLLVPGIGTVALLWVFMGLALMPLSRGMGPFEGFTIALLQLIGIY